MSGASKAGSIPQAGERSQEPGTWPVSRQGVSASRRDARERARATRAATAALGSPAPPEARSRAVTAATSTWISMRSRSGPDRREK